jgi:AcrR family transcriptional regulator
MTAIAERSGSGIGTLYHYFPDKQYIASALLEQYLQEVEAYWKPWIEQAEALSHTEFAEMFVERVIERLRGRPAYLQLLAVPIQCSRDPAARRAMRVAIANVFKAKDPSLTSEKAMLAANITVQMVNDMKMLYAEAGAREKSLIVAEYKKALTLYLGSVLFEGERSSKQRRR